jgi:hypothetical protein
MFPLLPDFSCTNVYSNAQEMELVENQSVEYPNDENNSNTVPVEVTVRVEFPEDFEIPDNAPYFRGLIFLSSFCLGVLLFNVFIDSFEQRRF